ncbi:hypothetical protein [Cloacibacillus sp.]|uniref:hypothetical protein n=1 Tax=Cloacibacillus sp. TaxID=2049023 RepID=UPI0025BDD828|nr:hypothetical protein [Cloacibacillus sp.]MCC8057222.1 hypothetical protein [Cloacibacillus sp.]
MADIAYPVLCGGTYFTLVLEARKQRTSQRSRYEGEKDGLSQTKTLEGLGKVVYPEYNPPRNEQTFRTNANAYKSCADDGSNLSFLFPDKKSAFDNRVKNDYQEALRAMCEFVDQFLEVSISIKKEEWLVKALLELIEGDASIPEDQLFFVRSDGQAIPKSAMRQESEFALQTLLLGLWHFVITTRTDNKSGKDTFDACCPSRDRAERKYEGNIGEGIKRKIRVDVLPTPTGEAAANDEAAATVESQLKENTATPPFDADPKRITVNNYGTVQNQKFISIETMNGDINL